MEQVIDWLNENEIRAYPLIDSSNRTVSLRGEANFTLPDNLLLDIQIKISGFSLLEKDIAFTGLFYHRDTETVELYVSSYTLTNPSDGSDLVVFSVPDVLTRDYPTYMRTMEGHLIVLGEGLKDYVAACKQLPNTYGDVSSRIPLPGIPLEPSVCVQFNDAWLGVNSIRSSPEKATIPGSYESLLPLVSVYDPSEEQTETNQPTVLDGDIHFLEGFNFSVNINDDLIDLAVNAGYGLLTNCETRFIDPIYLNCDELVSYINGIPPDDEGNFRLLPGNSIIISTGNTIDSTFEDSLTEPSNPNTLFVGLNFQSTDICAPVNVTPAI